MPAIPPVSPWPTNRCHAASLTVVMVAIVLAAGAGAQAADPLHARIDALVEAQPTIPLAPLVGDGEFIRRASLDLNGVIPTADDARAFVDDASPGKRDSLVDRLLASPLYAWRMANFFDVMLMERRPDKNVPSAEWQEYLRASFAQNKPYDQLAREILSADGASGDLRPAARFYLDRECEPSALTRDVGRVFLGRDMQCAQCHNHPLIAGYLQDDYYGIYSFFVRGNLFTGKDKKVVYAELAEGEINYKSVFTGDARERVPPCLPGDAPLVEPRFEPGQQYAVPPAKDVRPVPKFSRRAELARLATNGHNAEFNRNIVNRLWALLMGRGLVEPVDFQHVDNPPTNPAVLDLLAAEFVAMKFDVKALLRELTVTRTYQRASESRAIEPPSSGATASRLAALESEAARLAEVARQSDTAAAKPIAELADATQAADKAAAAWEAASKAVAAAKSAADAAAAALAKSRQESAAKADIARALADAAARSQAAAEKLPDDKVLAAAVAQIKKRSAEFAAALPALAQTVAQQEASAKTTADALSTAGVALAKAATELDASQRRVAQLVPPARAAEAKLAADKAAAASAQRRVADIKLLADLARVRGEVSLAESSAAKARADWIARQAAINEAEAPLARAQQAAAEALKQAEAASAALAAAQKIAEPKREAARLVADAAAKAQLAAEKVTGDDGLAQAVAQLKAKSDQLAAEFSALESDVSKHTEAARQAIERSSAARAEMDKATAALAAEKSRALAAEKQAKAADERAAELRKTADDKLAAAADRGSEIFALGSFKPISPEQLAWSVMQATGVLRAQRAAAAVELAKQKQPDAALPPDKQRQQRDTVLEKAVREKLAGNVATFVATFGPSGTSARDFQATVQQALFLSNGGTVTSWIAPRGDNLAARLLKISDTAALADELYLSVLSRRADDGERALVAQYVAAPGVDRSAAVQELIWSLLVSNEFRFNH